MIHRKRPCTYGLIHDLLQLAPDGRQYAMQTIVSNAELSMTHGKLHRHLTAMRLMETRRMIRSAIANAHALPPPPSPPVRGVTEQDLALAIRAASWPVIFERAQQADAWRTLAFDLVRAAGGVQRISLSTALKAHTKDRLQIDWEMNGDMVCRIIPGGKDVTYK